MSIQFVPGGTVEVPEISFKDEVQLPARETAVVVIDMQNDFVEPDGALVVPAASETVPHIRQLLDLARAHDVRIAYTQDTHLEDESGKSGPHTSRSAPGDGRLSKN
jgi:nicotinamidase-related amidase